MPYRWYPSMPCSRSPGGVYPSMPCRFPGPHPRGSLIDTGMWSPGPHPGGMFRGLAGGGVSRPTPKEEVEGSYLGRVSRPTPGGGFSSSPGSHPGGIPICTQADPPGLTATAVGAVRTLLECILILFSLHSCHRMLQLRAFRCK